MKLTDKAVREAIDAVKAYRFVEEFENEGEETERSCSLAVAIYILEEYLAAKERVKSALEKGAMREKQDRNNP